LIAIELAGIQYILNKTRDIFTDLDGIYYWPKSGFYERFKVRFSQSFWRYVAIATMILISLLIEFSYILGGYTLFIYEWENTYWSLAYDIYYHAINYLTYILLTIILWINSIIILVLNEVTNKPIQPKLKISVYSINREFGPLRNLILKISAIYFTCISLAGIASLNLTNIFSIEVFFFIFLLILGIIFFYDVISDMGTLIGSGIDFEQKEINDRCQEQLQKIIKIASKENYAENKEEINSINIMLEILHREKDKISMLDRKGYSLTTIGAFISTTILPILTLIEKIQAIKL
jgi:hypothetical protein